MGVPSPWGSRLKGELPDFSTISHPENGFFNTPIHPYARAGIVRYLIERVCRNPGKERVGTQ